MSAFVVSGGAKHSKHSFRQDALLRRFACAAVKWSVGCEDVRKALHKYENPDTPF